MPTLPCRICAALLRSRLLSLLLIGTLLPAAAAQTVSSSSATSSGSLPDAPRPQTAAAPTASAQQINLRTTPRRVLDDQKAIWTSPLHLRPQDAEWLLPLSVTTGVLLGSDQHTMTQLIKVRPADQKHFSTLSNGGIVALGAVPAGMYLWSLHADSPQAHETGILSGEALGDTLAVTESIKFLSRRDRPYVNNAQGSFFSSSFSNSGFPSNHAAAAWAIASVLGQEYPGWLSRTLFYGAATGISVSRILADQHYPSDVVVGSAAGWLIGHYVFRAHHDFGLDPFNPAPPPHTYLVPRPARQINAHTPPDPLVRPTPAIAARPAPPARNMDDVDPDTIGSTNVPMDSWVYPALERLSSMGFIPGQSVSIRPWTRQECLRQLHLAEDMASTPDEFSPALLTEARRLMNDLHFELAGDPPAYKTFALESVYARAGTIAGPALTDSFHFGQTWWNDFGRPLGRGTSAIAGYSVRAHEGRFFFYDRNEVQHGPGAPARSQAQTDLFNSVDRITGGDPYLQPLAAVPAYTRQRPIELYAGIAFAGNALSFGKQELYWGPTTMGPWAFSSNAEPTYSLRFDSTRPHPLPLVPAWGTYRFDIVFGKLSGHQYTARPWFNGQKADFNLGDNLEISFTRWSILWGVGHPITLHSLKANLLSFNSTGNYVGNGASLYGDPTDPGDRKSNFDFRYRLPWLRKAVTLYADAYSDDDPNPMDAPRRAAWNPGIYLARLPWLPHMDLRVEAASSEGLAADFGGGHFFINGQYMDGNTNKGFLLGNAVGRDSRAIEARTSYWFSARTRVEAGYRQNKGGTQFLARGTTISDGFVHATYSFTPHLQADLFLQHERFLVPTYLANAQHNTSARVEIIWTPQLHSDR
ncbi:MAG: phosphatase PAP2 family protein [Acidobacteriota bacterium]|nr:phosphatase PAP2 family protein [Acidobacteriota bacterium]